MEKARLILKALMDEGYEAYVVGGAVRDFLLGAQPQDIDIATSADPGSIKSVAKKNNWGTVETGVFFGVVLVIVDGSPYDVATFRTETYGRDSHRPETVSFAASLADDLSRRDFSMNAMAMDAKGDVIDYFSGLSDLRAGKIKTVGDPHLRFREDALRMFRAARFAATLGFQVDAETLAAIPENLYRVRGLSVERVRDEMDKTLTGQHAAKGMRLLLSYGLLDQECRARDSAKAQTVPILPEIRHLAGLEQNPRYHRLDAWEHTLATVEAIQADPLLRWAALLHDVAKGLPGVRSVNDWGEPVEHQHEVAGAEMAAEIAERLKFPSLWRKRLPWLVRQHLRLPPTEKEAVIRWLRRRSNEFKTAAELSDAMEQLLELHRADRLAGHRMPGIPEWERFNALLNQILRTIPFYPSQLLLSGEEIAKKIGKGPVVGRFQRTLLNRIQAGELMNTYETQRSALEKKAARCFEKQNK